MFASAKGIKQQKYCCRCDNTHCTLIPKTGRAGKRILDR